VALVAAGERCDRVGHCLGTPSDNKPGNCGRGGTGNCNRLKKEIRWGKEGREERCLSMGALE